MSPDEYASLKDDLQAVIVAWCDEAGIDVHDPAQVQACQRDIWNALEVSGKLHPEMTYQGFSMAIIFEGLKRGHI